MSYKALLFSSDEATARVIAQVLSELEFQAEPHKEPFAAVKALTSSQVDAMVIDCANEQDAALLVKSARNSASNQQSLFIAIVDGKSGVTSAFRLGANLVLTKPVSMEQAKNTLRMARGLLQKNVAAKTAPAVASQVSQSKPPVSAPKVEAPSAAPVVAPPIVPPSITPPPISAAPAAAAPAPAMTKAPVIPSAWMPSSQVAVPSASVLETEKETAPSLDAADAGLLDSLPEVAAPQPPVQSAPPAVSARKEFPWQKAPQPAAESVPVSVEEAEPAAPAVPKFAFKPPAKSESPLAAAPMSSSPVLPGPTKPFAPRPVTVAASAGAAAAAAPAPARIAEPEQPVIEEVTSGESVEEEAPAPVEEPAAPAKVGKAPKAAAPDNKKWLLIAAVVVAVAAIGYVGWTKFGSAPAAAPAPHATPAAASQSAVPVATQPATQMTPTSSQTTNQSKSQLIASTAAKPSATAPAQKVPFVEPVSAAPAQPNPDVVVVTNQPATPPPAPKPTAVEAAAAPNVMEVTSGSGTSSISSVVSGAPAASTPTLVAAAPVSQGVAQGILMKRVQPVYPPQARAMHLGGPVTLSATVAKDGSVKNLKQVSGDPVLGQAAIDAVKQWKYSPYLLDGQPVDTPTQITVNFKAQ
ncbi:MAG TPA: TonB family protein [Terriglobales bacterium]